MKIIYISGANFPSEVSHTLSKMRMCQALADEGHEVILSAFKNKVKVDDVMAYYGLLGGFNLNLINLPFWLNYKFIKNLQLHKLYAAVINRKIIQKFKPDLVYSRLTLQELFLVPKAVPIIYEMHSLGFLGKKRLARMLFRLLVSVKSFKYFISSTNTLSDLLKKSLPKNEVLVARLSAELPIKIEASKIKNFRSNQLQGSEYKYHVGFTGYLDTVGLRGTEVICQLASKLPECAFHIVGGQKIAVEYWKNYGKDHNQNQNLFFYGHRNPSEIPYFLDCFDIVLAPLQFKPSSRAPTGENMSPLKLPQYMAYKKAIVASDLPAHREVLDGDRTALLVKCDDIEAWADAIKFLIHNPEKRSKMGLEAFQEYQKGYTPAARIKSILGKFSQSNTLS